MQDLIEEADIFTCVEVYNKVFAGNSSATVTDTNICLTVDEDEAHNIVTSYMGVQS